MGFLSRGPLQFGGEYVGVLCIGDTKPRDFSADEDRSLRDLAALAEQELQVTGLSETQLALARANDELYMKANVDVLNRLWNRLAMFEIAETERIRANQAKATIEFDQHSIAFTCSVGYAIAAASEPIDGPVRLADQALYSARSNGRNRVEPPAVRASFASVITTG